MKILLLFCLLLFNFSHAKVIEATYKISYGIFGELGEAKTTFELFENNTYHIKVEAYATGIAKVLSSNKKETYESFGSIINAQLIPKKFIKTSSNDYKYRSKTYLFNHQKKEVLLKRFDKRLQTKHNENLEAIQTWQTSKSSSLNSYFASNDLLSLFFNLKQIVPSFQQGKAYELKAIGANKTNGKLDIIIPIGEQYQSLQETLQTDSIKFIAAIHQKIFSSQKGELFVSLNNEGFCNKAVLKDVLIFGDITGEMISFTIEENS